MKIFININNIITVINIISISCSSSIVVVVGSGGLDVGGKHLSGKGCDRRDKCVNIMLQQKVEHRNIEPKVFLLLLIMVS